MAEKTGSPPAATLDVIDAEHRVPSGLPCPNCGCPVEATDHFCPACGTANENAGAVPARRATTSTDKAVVVAEVLEPPAGRHFRCEQCGAEVLVDKGQRSYHCPFCDSNYVVEFQFENVDRQRPEFIIGFAVTPDQAREKFRQWIRQNAWFNPGDLAVASVEEKQRGVYLPFWSFPMLAESDWQAEIGEHWQRTETYTDWEDGKAVTKTRTVTETEWWTLSGRHHRFYAGALISASKGLPQEAAASIQPFQLPALKRYEPFYLAGWLCEEYSIEREEALALCQQTYHAQEQQNIRAFLPGDTARGLQVHTEFSHVSSDLCLLPVYVLGYRYQGRVYRFLVNGQTGRCEGEKPVSWQRITIAVVAGLVLLFLLFAIIMISLQP